MSLFQNLIRISSGRGANEVEDLRGDVLRKASHRVVKLSLGYRDGFDSKLCICLRKPNSSCFGPEHGKFKSTFAATTDGGGSRSALEAPTGSGVLSTLGMSDEISLVHANKFPKKLKKTHIEKEFLKSMKVLKHVYHVGVTTLART